MSSSPLKQLMTAENNEERKRYALEIIHHDPPYPASLVGHAMKCIESSNIAEGEYGTNPNYTSAIGNGQARYPDSQSRSAPAKVDSQVQLLEKFRSHLRLAEFKQAATVIQAMQSLRYPESIVEGLLLELDQAEGASDFAYKVNSRLISEGLPSLSPRNYLLHRPDLQAAGFTVAQASEHLIKYGIKELKGEALERRPNIRRYLDLNDSLDDDLWLLRCSAKPRHPDGLHLNGSQKDPVPTHHLDLSSLRICLPESGLEVSLQEFAAWALIRNGVRYICLVDETDHLLEGWNHALTEKLKSTEDTIVFSEEFYSIDGKKEHRNRQHKSKPTAFRIFTRGYVSGVVAIPTKILERASLKGSYQSTWCLQVDIAQQHYEGIKVLNTPLVVRDQISNPALLEYGDKVARSYFEAVSAEFRAITLCNLARTHRLRKEPRVEFTAGENGEIVPILAPGCKPVKVSVIIPFRDQSNLLKCCINSLLDNERTCKLEIILADNGSIERETHDLINSLLNNPNVAIKHILINEPFNFSRINNIAATRASGDYLLLLNNDIEFRSTNPISALLAYFCLANIGAVGSRLYYEDGSIQHQGIVLTPFEPYDTYSPFKTTHDSQYDYSLSSLCSTDQWSAATAALLLIERLTWLEVGGLDEELVVAYNDVDLCLRIQEAGKETIVCPSPHIVHYESKSRGLDLGGKKYNRLYKEAGYLRDKNSKYFQDHDPFWPSTLSISNPRATPRHLDSPDLVSVDSPLAIIKRLQGGQSIGSENRNDLCVYVNYSSTNRIRPDVLDQLKQISLQYTLIFVTTSTTAIESDPLFEELRGYVTHIAIRGNIGYDFGSWKAGILDNLELVLSADSLLLMNDSLYGPLTPLDQMLDDTKKSNSDVTCMTINHVGGLHAQSYYVSYKPSVLQSAGFTAFWKSVPVYCDKYQLIKNCEMRWSQYLRETGRSVTALFDTGTFGNQTHIDWKNLVIKHGCPFIKNELIMKNPVAQDLSGIAEIMTANHTLYEMMCKYWQTTNEKTVLQETNVPTGSGKMSPLSSVHPGA